MKKIPTVFKQDDISRLAIEEINQECSWIFDDDVIATLKLDGMPCMVKDKIIYKRCDKRLKPEFVKHLRANKDFKVKEHMFTQLPEGAIPCDEMPDSITYHHPHWIKIDKRNTDDKYFFEALENFQGKLRDGTYEMIGEKSNRNPYGMTGHMMVPHGETVLDIKDKSFEGLKVFLETLDGEGVVFHQQSTGKMAKCRKKDFNISWSVADTRDNRQKMKMR